MNSSSALIDGALIIIAVIVAVSILDALHRRLAWRRDCQRALRMADGGPARDGEREPVGRSTDDRVSL